MNHHLSDSDIQLVADALAKLEPGFLPAPIFNQVVRLTTIPIVELVPLRHSAAGVEILLVRRDADDPVWPGQLHVPGTVIRATDTIESALRRVLDGELQSPDTPRPKYVKNIVHHSGRGLESSLVYWVALDHDVTVGTFYNVDNLPDNLVASQMDFIPAAIEDYRKTLQD